MIRVRPVDFRRDTCGTGRITYLVDFSTQRPDFSLLILTPSLVKMSAGIVLGDDGGRNGVGVETCVWPHRHDVRH